MPSFFVCQVKLVCFNDSNMELPSWEKIFSRKKQSFYLSVCSAHLPHQAPELKPRTYSSYVHFTSWKPSPTSVDWKPGGGIENKEGKVRLNVSGVREDWPRADDAQRCRPSIESVRKCCCLFSDSNTSLVVSWSSGGILSVSRSCSNMSSDDGKSGCVTEGNNWSNSKCWRET